MLETELNVEALQLSLPRGNRRLHLRSDHRPSPQPAPLVRGLDYRQLCGALHSMSQALNARDAYTQAHSQRVARLAFELATLRGLSVEASHEIYLAGILHDIGKIGIPDAVLLKAEGLTEDDLRAIRRHPEIGYKIVEQVESLQFALPGILYHHEQWDGAGYPHRLAGESIPLMARILAVADAFDAMTSSRPYRPAMPLERAREIICNGSETHWDASLVELLMCWIDERSSTQRVLVRPPHSLIPQGSPVETMHQAIVNLSH
jgi:HD-GYP domain-containing protein (c-di-GMP phosphodiesterase class II)